MMNNQNKTSAIAPISFVLLNKTKAIAPIGSVLLKNGKNKEFGNVFDCWAEKTVTLILFKRVETPSDNGFPPASSWKVVATGSADVAAVSASHPVSDDIHRFFNDQTLRPLVGEWKIAGVFEHSLDGFKALKAHTKLTALYFATYK